jgi:hypothetical protein
MSDTPHSGEYHRADPVYRRQMQVFLGVTVIVGLAALAMLHYWLAGLGARLAAGDLFIYEKWMHRLLGGMCLLLAATSGGFAQWLFRMASATKGERRWPPSSMRTSADVRIRYLTSADSLVAQLKFGALCLALLSAALAGWAIWLFWST